MCHSGSKRVKDVNKNIDYTIYKLYMGGSIKISKSSRNTTFLNYRMGVYYPNVVTSDGVVKLTSLQTVEICSCMV